MNDIDILLTEYLSTWSSAGDSKQNIAGRRSENFGKIYGVQKLRELIYGLAANGRIVGFEESAKKCLLGDVSDFIMGQAPPGSECNKNGDGVAFVKTGEFGLLYPKVQEWTTKPLKCAKKGDVLICVVGATIGKLNLAIDCAIGRSVAAIRPKEVLDTRYLYLALVPFTLKLRNKSRGSAQGVIGKTELASVSIFVPSLETQKRLVAKLDELMAICDLLEKKALDSMDNHQILVEEFLKFLSISKNLDEFINNWNIVSNSFEILFSSGNSIEAIKSTILELAITGKLVQQDLGDESAENLLKRISNIRLSAISVGKVRGGKSGNPPENTTANSHELPVNWVLTTLQDVYDVRDGTHDTPKYQESGYPLVTSKNLYSGRLDFSDIKFISNEDHLKIKKRSQVNSGDVLFAMIGTIGNPVIVDTKEEFSIKNIALFKPYATECSEMKYLLIFLKHITAQLKSDASGAVQSFVSLSMLRNYPFLLPPLAEQKRIVNKVEKLFLICDQLKALIEHANEIQRKIADALVEEVLT